jgi:hypothetical protein
METHLYWFSSMMKWHHFLKATLVLKDQSFTRNTPFNMCLLPKNFQKNQFSNWYSKEIDVIDLGFGFKSNCNPKWVNFDCQQQFLYFSLDQIRCWTTVRLIWSFFVSTDIVKASICHFFWIIAALFSSYTLLLRHQSTKINFDRC